MTTLILFAAAALLAAVSAVTYVQWRSSSRTAPSTAVTLSVDPEPFIDQLARLGQAWAQMRDTFAQQLAPAVTAAGAALANFARALSPYFAANQPEHVAGLEARYFVRAGLDPAYVDPRALDQLVQQILAGDDTALQYVSDENRSLIAASALTGWVGSHAGTETLQVLAWHRQMPDGQRLSVGRAS